jgi:hypothetical protein
VKAQIPQSLVLPSRSLAFFENKLPAGHLFNDAQYGDIIIWKRLPVQVFIDTRYDMYGPVLIADYLSINRCEPGWEQLLDKYEISCIFIPKAGLSLSEKLSANKQWQPIYADSVCCIFKRGKR